MTPLLDDQTAYATGIERKPVGGRLSDRSGSGVLKSPADACGGVAIEPKELHASMHTEKRLRAATLLSGNATDFCWLCDESQLFLPTL